MHSNTADTPKITVDEYPRMQSYGWIAAVCGGLGLVVLLTLGLSTRIVLPTGLASLTMGSFTVGCILLVGRLFLMKLDEHRADHATATLAVEDVHRIEQGLTDVTEKMGGVQDQLAGLRVQMAHADLIADPDKFEAAVLAAVRKSYAQGAVDMLDGRADVIPLGQNGLRVVPAREQPK